MSNRFQFQTDTPVNTGPTVDFDALNQHIADVVDAPQPDARILIISGVVDLGYQKQEDAKMKWEGTDAQRAEIEAKAAAGETQEYFEVVEYGQNNVPTLCKRWPSKDQREIAIFLDDPTKLVNYGQFFGHEDGGKEVPYRMMLNNEFYNKDMGGKIPGRDINLREHRNDDGTWGFKSNTILFKMGQAVGALDAQGNMKPQYLGNLIGKAVLCNVTCAITESGGKKYLTEKVGFNGPVPSMMKPMIPTLADEHMFMINFKGENDPEALKTLRQSCINKIVRATNFADSDLRKQLIAVGKIKEDQGNLTGGAAQGASKGPVSAQPAQSAQAAPQAAVDFDSFDDDIPFAPIGLQEGRNFLHMI